MTERIFCLKKRIIAKEHQRHLRSLSVDLASEYSRLALPPQERMLRRLEFMLASEKPCLDADEKLVLTRTIGNLPDIFTAAEWADIRSRHYIHELGYVSNVTPNYYDLIRSGFAKRRQAIQAALPAASAEAGSFWQGQLRVMQAVSSFVARYRAQALSLGNTEVAAILGRIPEEGARTFHEALQFFRILHFTLWLEGEYHNTIGRFDLQMNAWLENDLAAGRLSEEAALELLEEFFLSFNKDSNLYPGVQQGDNGQSMVLGGIGPDGAEVFNSLTRLCLLASQELRLIDPKINLRVSKNTPLASYQLGTDLTRAGMGFPQYSNDDVVIPGLIKLGYAAADAADYTVAACWEFIIPGKGMEVPNIGAVSFPAILDRSLREDLPEAADFASYLDSIDRRIKAACLEQVQSCRNLWFIPAPFLSLLMDDCQKQAKDISCGSRYNNWGLHGTGIATAVDSLIAIRQLVFDQASLPAAELLEAVEQDFANQAGLLHQLRYELPKLGDGSPEPEKLLVWLLDSFADSLKDLRNERGGRIRPGTGTAMYYLWHSQELPASPDGRRKGEPFAANYSPSLFARLPGPVSIIKSFTRPDLSKVINGGPLTLEFHDSLFRTKENCTKVAALIKWYIDRGGHQLQLNAINRAALKEAQKHPERHGNLIVRIWGWSAYFCELDEAYQNHVIQRTEHTGIN